MDRTKTYHDYRINCSPFTNEHLNFLLQCFGPEVEAIYDRSEVRVHLHVRDDADERVCKMLKAYELSYTYLATNWAKNDETDENKEETMNDSKIMKDLLDKKDIPAEDGETIGIRVITDDLHLEDAVEIQTRLILVLKGLAIPEGLTFCNVMTNSGNDVAYFIENHDITKDEFEAIIGAMGDYSYSKNLVRVRIRKYITPTFSYRSADIKDQD